MSITEMPDITVKRAPGAASIPNARSNSTQGSVRAVSFSGAIFSSPRLRIPVTVLEGSLALANPLTAKVMAISAVQRRKDTFGKADIIP